MAKNRMFIGLGAAVILLAGLPADAEGLPKRFEFGRIPLGAQVNKVPRWALKGDCKNTDNSLGHCGFYDAQGVDYLIFDYAVCEKTFHVNRWNIGSIPYGIDYRATKSEIVGRLSKKLKLRFEEVEKRWFTSDGITSDAFDGVVINLRFDRNDKLSTVNLWSNCT